jgi:hypothetical protein
MCTSRSRLAELRAKAFPYLQGIDFNDAIDAAAEYHRTHPVTEFIDKQPNLNLRDRRAQHVMTAVHQNTLDKLYNEHRDALVKIICDRARTSSGQLMPHDLAEELVDQLILAE